MAADLGTLPGHRDAFVQPVAMNDKSAVAAQVTWDARRPPEASGVRLAERQAGTGLTFRHEPWVDVAAINNRGDVVGDANAPLEGLRPSPFLWRNGKAAALGTLGGTDSEHSGSTTAEQVVGTSRTPTAARHAFFWQNGAMTDLGTLGGDDLFPTALNNEGQVIGESTTQDGAEHAFLWQHGAMTDSAAWTATRASRGRSTTQARSPATSTRPPERATRSRPSCGRKES